MKITASYKRGFKEGFNNPKINKEQATKFLESGKEFKSDKAQEYFEGLISGITTREKELSEGKNRFIMSEKDLNEVLR